MPFTIEEIKERKKISSAKYRLANIEKIKESNAIYRLNNKEKIKETYSKYRLNNKDKIATRTKNYKKTDLGKKKNTISQWKSRGIIGDYDTLYEIYIDTLICDNCQVWLNTNKKTIRCHDHCDNCGLSKGMVCWECNIHNKVECQACN